MSIPQWILFWIPKQNILLYPFCTHNSLYTINFITYHIELFTYSYFLTHYLSHCNVNFWCLVKCLAHRYSISMFWAELNWNEILSIQLMLVPSLKVEIQILNIFTGCCNKDRLLREIISISITTDKWFMNSFIHQLCVISVTWECVHGLRDFLFFKFQFYITSYK